MKASLLRPLSYLLEKLTFNSRVTRSDSIAFVHIPKTAGMSLYRAMESIVGVRNALLVPPRDGNVGRDTFAGLSSRDIERLRLISGHMGFDAIRRRLDPRQWKFISLVRQPVDRELSDYYYIRGAESHPLHAEICRLSLEGYVEARVAACPNRQCSLLCGEPSYAKAIECVDKDYFLVGCTEFYAEFVSALWAALAWPHPERALRKENVTPQRLEVDQVPRHVVEAIGRYTEQDQRLYATIRARWSDGLRAA